MQFGIILPNYGPNSSTTGVVEVAKTAEDLNFDSIWTTDHILLPKTDSDRFGHLYEAISTLCFLAGMTNRIRLGISSLVLPQRSPILVAKQLATLDAFSGGRALLCVGVGWSAGEYRNLGSSFKDRGRRMDEAVELIRALWSANEAKTVSFDGDYYQFTEAVFSPHPVQFGGPSIWVGGSSAPAIRRAAKLGDGWHPSSLSLENFSELAGVYLRFPEAKGGILSARLRLSFDESDPAAQLLGPPAEVKEVLAEYQKAGLQYAVISLPGETSEEQLEAMHIFAKDVVPQFKAE